VEMFRREGHCDVQDGDIDHEVNEILEQTLHDLYAALDAKNRLIDRLVARLRELGQGGPQEEATVPHKVRCRLHEEKEGTGHLVRSSYTLRSSQTGRANQHLSEQQL